MPCLESTKTTGRPAIWLLRILVTILLLALLFVSFAEATATARHAQRAGSPAGPTPTPTPSSAVLMPGIRSRCAPFESGRPVFRACQPSLSA